MIFSVIHLLAGTALVTAAIHRLVKKGNAPTARKALFPFIIAASLIGMILSYMYAMEFFVGFYSGAKYELAAAKFRLTGPYGWIYLFLAITPLLPAAAILPWIGRRPLTVALLGILALLPEALMVISRILNS